MSPRARIVAILGLFVFLWGVTPPAISVCGFHWLTGLRCPLCGLTRALFALGKGRVWDALHLHALSPLGLAMLVALFWNHSWRERIWKGGVPAFAIYGVLRWFVPGI